MPVDTTKMSPSMDRSFEMLGMVTVKLTSVSFQVVSLLSQDSTFTDIIASKSQARRDDDVLRLETGLKLISEL